MAGRGILKLISKAELAEAEQTIYVTVLLRKNTQEKLWIIFSEYSVYLMKHILHPFCRRFMFHLMPLLNYSCIFVHFLQIKLVERYQDT